ncbi:MAG TPA: SDR family oxidoreductase, partial [Acidimicrobiales bacterium]|nr:SDR family oxidoreductase [Acidimicrobiales bacterium]
MARPGAAPARRRVVVTGGSGGIGRALLAAFAGEGHEVVAMARDPEALRAAVATVGASSGGEVVPVPCDVADEEAVAAAFAGFSRVDVLVTGAGVAEAAPLARTTLAAWRHHLDANATGTFLCARAVLPGMAEAGWGRIVAVASTAARVGSRYTAAYTASKHAALGLVRAVAAEV